MGELAVRDRTHPIAVECTFGHRRAAIRLELMKLLIIGGSGFLSGTLARTALAAGHDVWTVTRGERPVPQGAQAIVANRKDQEAFAGAVSAAQEKWDLVVDCIGFAAEDARQDLRVFRDCAWHLVFISTDFVIDPQQREFPQGEEAQGYATTGYGHHKRQCELELLDSDPSPLQWTVLRPCHIYGPGSQLGCLPAHGRDTKLLARLQANEPLQLVGGGHFLQQPIFAPDLATLVLSCAGKPSTFGQVFMAAGPAIVESREYYRIIAEQLQTELRVEELPVGEYLRAHPEAAPFLCHRIYDLAKLRTAELAVPATPLREGLQQQVASLLAATS